MPKVLMIAALLFNMPIAAVAQPILTGANSNPVSGDQFLYVNCKDTLLSLGASGANVTWNYSDLISLTQDTLVIHNCTATPYCSSFPGSSIAMASPNSIGYGYHKADVGYLAVTGDTSAVLGQEHMSLYTNFKDVIHYPFTYASSYNDNYRRIYSDPDHFSSGNVIATADAYGTLILPSGSFNNVLRVHRTETETDSQKVSSIWYVTSSIIDVYDWYTPGYHVPLLQMWVYMGAIEGAAYTKTMTTSIENNRLEVNSLQIYPNPASGAVAMKFDIDVQQRIVVSLFDMMGRKLQTFSDRVYMQGAHSMQYDLSQLETGLYFIRLSTGTKNIYKKIEVSK